jgi:hypothetical protein
VSTTALVPLGQVVADAPEDQEPVPGFVGRFEGAEYRVTAMLQRTAVLEVPGDRWADKEVVLLGDVLVDPAAIRWRPKPPPVSYRSWRGRHRVGADPEARRQASDERARADQERQRAVEAVAAPARRPVATSSLVPVRPVEPAGPRPAAPPAAAPERRPVPARPRRRVPTVEPDDAAARLAAAISEVVGELEQARARIEALEAERARTRAAQRRLMRRARAAMRREAS